MGSLIESELISQARQGDEAAWELLMRAHQEAAYRLAYLFLGDPDEAEDIVQDAFLRASHALPRFDLERPFRPWLLSITANLARNRRRSAGRYLAVLRRFWQVEPDHTIHPETEAAQNWETDTLWQAVRRLAFADQQVIYYRFFLDLPVEETAAALGIPEGTVKSRLHRAVIRLRLVIEQEYPALMKGFQA
jgi:RNA polymerase sigma-70 factor (ECF subfamily)